MTTQMGAVTGRRYPANYVADINARVPYSLQIAQAQKDDEYRQAVLNQEAQRMAAEKQFADEQLDLQESQTRKANILGMGNLAANTYFGYKRANPVADVVSAPGTGNVPVSGSDVPRFAAGGETGLGAATGLSSLTTAAPWKSALTDWKAMGLSGLAGAGLGESVGGLIPFGGDKEKKVMGGALVGGVTSGLVSGWDPASMITGAIIGGGASWFF